MPWDVMNIIGTIAFAVSGAIVAMEERYDILGVFVLGFATAFGGGIVRNLLIGLPVPSVWGQSMLFKVAFVSMIIIFFSPVKWIQRSFHMINFFDAIGLSAFAIQGGLYAYQTHHGVAAVVAASVMTGVGGGMIRDVLAKRKPLVLREEIYAVWAVVVGLVIGLGWVTGPYVLYALFVLVVVFRMVSLHYRWRLPVRTLTRSGSNLDEKVGKSV
jgi:uncharacterized membrane protein YeiH